MFIKRTKVFSRQGNNIPSHFFKFNAFFPGFFSLYARKGEANSYLHFYRILTKIAKKLGDEALQNMHIHISGSLFGDKGEIKHLNLAETDFRYDEWVQALKDFSVKGMVISESPDQATDAIMLKKLFYG